MRKIIGIIMVIVGLLLITFTIFEGIMMDQEISQYVFINTDILGILLGLGLGLFFAPLKAKMI